MDASSPIVAWLAAESVRGHYRLSVAEAYANYAAWAVRRDPHAWVESVKMFSMQLGQLGYAKTRTNAKRYVLGLRLLTEAEKALII